MADLRRYAFGEVTVNFDSKRSPVRASDRRSGPYPYYGASGIVDHVDEYLFEGDYLLVAEDGENLRTRRTPIAFMATGRFWANNHAHVVKANNLSNIRYLGYLLNRADISGFLSGSTQPKLTKSALNSIGLRLPSRQYQDAAVELVNALDEKVANNGRLADICLQLSSALYFNAARSQTWISVALGDAARWQSGGTPRTGEAAYWSGGDIPWISALSLKSPWVEKSDRMITSLGARNGTRLVPRDTVIFVVRGSSLKDEFRIGITQREVAFGQDCKALNPHMGIDSHILFHAIRSRTAEMLSLVDETGIGAGRLSTDLISKVAIRVPVDTGDVIIGKIRSLDEIAASRQAESRGLTQLRESLVPRLLSGHLLIKDAEKIVEDST